MLLVTERVAGLRILELPDRHDISGGRRGDGRVLLAQQLIHMTAFLFDSSRPVVQQRICLQGAGRNADIRQPSDERVDDGLEDDSGKRRLGCRSPRDLVAVRILPRERPALCSVGRRRQQVDDRIEQRNDPDILERRSRIQRHDRPGLDSQPESPHQVCLRQFAAGEVLFQQLIIALGGRLLNPLARVGQRRLGARWHRLLLPLRGVGPGMHRRLVHKIQDAHPLRARL